MVTPPTNRDPESNVISFLDLVSLETVCRFRDQGTSLQKVRKVFEALRSAEPGITHPLARRSFFTDGVSVWARVNGHTQEIVGRYRGNLTFTRAIKTLAHEIRFVSDVAVAWDISPWVAIDPAVRFGAPVARGTRIPVSTVMANLAEATEEEVADWYQLSVCQVRGVAEFAA